MRILVSAAISLGLLAAAAASVTARAEDPDFVNVVGTLQHLLGCNQDWAPPCTQSALLADSGDRIWQRSFVLPAGSYFYGVALHGDWSEPYGRHAHAMTPGYEIALQLTDARQVKFYYDPVTHWVFDDADTRIVTAPGNFQSELGCSGDWQPDCLRSLLEDVDGDGVFEREWRGLPVGSYAFRIAIAESWSETWGAGGAANGPNIDFTIDSTDDVVRLRFVSAGNLASVSVRFGSLFRDSFDP